MTHDIIGTGNGDYTITLSSIVLCSPVQISTHPDLVKQFPEVKEIWGFSLLIAGHFIFFNFPDNQSAAIYEHERIVKAMHEDSSMAHAKVEDFARAIFGKKWHKKVEV